MLRWLLIVLLQVAILIPSVAAAKSNVENPNLSKRTPVSKNVRLFVNEKDVPAAHVSKYGSYSTVQTFAPSRQVMGYVAIEKDNWQEMANGRQIAYTEYYNAACDYVAMDWHTREANPYPYPSFWPVLAGFYDCSEENWSYDIGVVVLADSGSYPQMAVEPGTGNPIAAFSTYTYDFNMYLRTGRGQCEDYYWIFDPWLPSAPNIEGINTGYCGDVNQYQTPYLWPHHDADTNSAGETVIHVAAVESCDCTAMEGEIETLSLIYYRKIGGEAWDGPHFIDSGYLSSQIVAADRNGPNVYYCYPKPLYYQIGPTPHPCDNGNAPGYYQDCQDIVYRMSTNDGASWGPVIKVTDYAKGFEDGLTDPSRYDLSAMVDPNGILHLVWWSNDWYRDSADATVCGENSGFYSTGKLWHYDTGNDCISVAYDASHPKYFKTLNSNGFGRYRTACTKPNISWCDDKLYITFERFGAHPVGDTSIEVGAGNPAEDTLYQVADIFVVGSDEIGGNMGEAWSNAINLTDTESDSCLPGECFSETWPSMSMFSTDSLMILYLEDKDPGVGYAWEEGLVTVNPVMFMTWPCFTMADAGSNPCLSTDPVSTVYQEIALAPNGNTEGCTTPAAHIESTIIHNCGNTGMTYLTYSYAPWLTVISGASGSIAAAREGPRNSDSPEWEGASGCDIPSTITWQANSASLGAGNYTSSIIVDVSDPTLEDIVIEVHLIAACDYYMPEYANIFSGCWWVDLFNTPQAGNGKNNNGNGNMKFYSCGDTIAPLFKEAMIIGWKSGSNIYCYTDYSDDHMGELLPASLSSYQRQNARMRALGNLSSGFVGNPVGGSGYTFASGYWCTPDSIVHGKIEYFVPAHPDTAVLIEKVSIWNESDVALNNFLVGEGIDWDVCRDSNKDDAGVDVSRKMVYQTGSGPDADISAGLSPYSGEDENYGAAVLDNPAWIYPDTGYNIIDIYNYMVDSLPGRYILFEDSLTDLNSIFRFYEGTLAANGADTLVFSTVKAVSIGGRLTGLESLIDKGKTFIQDNDLHGPPCQGRCGDANGDAGINVSDAVHIINFVFVGGSGLIPVQACGNANGDENVNVSDVVYIINFVFVNGSAPGDCHPGIWGSFGGDCCPY